MTPSPLSEMTKALEGVTEFPLQPCPFCASDRITTQHIRDGARCVCKDCGSAGALSHNRKPVREWCDKIFKLNGELETALDDAGAPIFPEDEAWTSEPERFRIFTAATPTSSTSGGE